MSETCLQSSEYKFRLPQRRNVQIIFGDLGINSMPNSCTHLYSDCGPFQVTYVRSPQNKSARMDRLREYFKDRLTPLAVRYIELGKKREAKFLMERRGRDALCER